MPEKPFSAKRERLMLAVLLCVLLAAYALVGTKKAYLHMDEAYSLGLCQYDRVDLTENPDFYDVWHDADYYADYLSLGEDQRGDLNAVYANQRDDVHPPLYYLLLRLFLNLAPGQVAFWTGILLNLLLQIPTVLLLYAICKRLFSRPGTAFAFTAIASLTMAAFSSVVFLRMYALTAVWVLLTLWLHLRVGERETLYPLLPAVGLTALLGSLTHYYYLLFLAPLALLTVVRLAQEKRKRELVFYLLTLVAAGVASVAVFPFSFLHLFFGDRGQEALQSVFHPLLRLLNVKFSVLALDRYAFNRTLLPMLLVGAGCAIYARIRRKKRGTAVFPRDKAFQTVALPVAFYTVSVALLSPYGTLRYYLPVCGLLTVLVGSAFLRLLAGVLKPRSVCALLSLLLALSVALPAVFGDEPETLYAERRETVSRIKDAHALPAVCCVDSRCDRFLDDVYLFTLLDASRVTLDPACTEDAFRQIFDGQDTSDGVLVFRFRGEDAPFPQTVQSAFGFSECRLLTKLEFYDVYYVGNKPEP